MKINVLYFGQLRAAMGGPAQVVDTDCQTAGALFDQLQIGERAGLAKTQIKPAINEEFAGHDAAVRDGDTVAFLPPLAGG